MGALKIAAATLLLGLAVAPASASAAPGFLGRGHDPGVAVDAAGTAHVAWLAEAAGQEGVLEYCQVPRGKERAPCAAACRCATTATARSRCCSHGPAPSGSWRRCCARPHS